ncbi:MAG: diguanylate cyclase [Polyangiales bacterium]
MKVIVAEDDRATRIVLCRTIERWGYEPVEACDGEEAWALLQEHDARLLLCDWEMPRLDGPALCERVRGADGLGYVYVVLLTAHRDAVHLVQGLDAGADDFIGKPFSVPELRARLKTGRRLATMHAELAAKARALAEANAELSRLASTDALTGLGNRRGFELAIDRIHAFSRAQGRGYATLVVDIDHFKRVNDQHGHLVGDRVIAAAGSALRSACDGHGEVFRYGGEEFVVLAAVDDRDGLASLGESLRARVAERPAVDDLGASVAVTASVGAALCDGDDARGWSAVLQRADDALYAAKLAGRDRVVTALP